MTPAMMIVYAASAFLARATISIGGRAFPISAIQSVTRAMPLGVPPHPQPVSTMQKHRRQAGSRDQPQSRAVVLVQAQAVSAADVPNG